MTNSHQRNSATWRSCSRHGWLIALRSFWTSSRSMHVRVRGVCRLSWHSWSIVCRGSRGEVASSHVRLVVRGARAVAELAVLEEWEEAVVARVVPLAYVDLVRPSWRLIGAVFVVASRN